MLLGNKDQNLLLISFLLATLSAVLVIKDTQEFFWSIGFLALGIVISYFAYYKSFLMILVKALPLGLFLVTAFFLVENPWDWLSLLPVLLVGAILLPVNALIQAVIAIRLRTTNHHRNT